MVTPLEIKKFMNIINEAVEPVTAGSSPGNADLTKKLADFVLNLIWADNLYRSRDDEKGALAYQKKADKIAKTLPKNIADGFDNYFAEIRYINRAENRQQYELRTSLGIDPDLFYELVQPEVSWDVYRPDVETTSASSWEVHLPKWKRVLTSQGTILGLINVLTSKRSSNRDKNAARESLSKLLPQFKAAVEKLPLE
jgi:hypothetical protein